MKEKTAIIIGAGPAGLTAAYELLKYTDIKPIILESSRSIGGISKTVNHKGYRIDIGGHRFFSKSDLIMEWWENILPLQGKPSKDDLILKREIPLSSKPNAPDPELTDKVMLARSRLSRIYFLRKFFDYPISVKWSTFSNLGLMRVSKIILSYMHASFFPIKPEKNLEDFFINRFGRELYLTFFKDYTEKVWGVPCSSIKPEWGAQRIKGLSVFNTILHAITAIFTKDHSIFQKKVETSLIGQFLYPKYGPGQLWEEVAEIINEKGGSLFFEHHVERLEITNSRVNCVYVKHKHDSSIIKFKPDYVFSSMPIKDLISGIQPTPPKEVLKVASGLQYRDFITVGFLLNKLKIKNSTKYKTVNNIIPDNWIYIQERDVKIGRIQIFNNWSPYLVKDPSKIWIGLEYFANEGDELWSMDDNALSNLAINELVKIDFIDNPDDVIDFVIIRTPKAYPAYFGTYEQFHVIKDFLNKIENLFPIGRNGMHRYNNQDHSMLTAIETVKSIKKGTNNKNNIWNVNCDNEYHEEK